MYIVEPLVHYDMAVNMYTGAKVYLFQNVACLIALGVYLCFALFCHVHYTPLTFMYVYVHVLHKYDFLMYKPLEAPYNHA